MYIASFDNDPAGAILQWGAARKSPDEAARTEWLKANIRSSGAAQSWMSPGINSQHLIAILSPGRNEGHVRTTVLRAMGALEQHGLLQPLRIDSNLSSPHRELSVLGLELIVSDAHREYLLGLRYVVERWSESCLRVAYEEKGIGTGCLAGPKRVLTAKHVIEPGADFAVTTIDGSVLRHSKVIVPVAPKDLDLALIELDDSATARPVRLGMAPEVLDEIVTLGFPPIPQSKQSVLVANRGEVSALTTTYFDQEFVIFSSLLRGGNSGGPAFDRRGFLAGIVSQRLFGQQVASAEDKGAAAAADIAEALGYSALIPPHWISDFLNGKLETRVLYG